jgi:hypothetical protein
MKEAKKYIPEMKHQWLRNTGYGIYDDRDLKKVI